MIIKQEVVNILNKALKLPASGNEQDWAIELADYKRLLEFINYMNNSFLNDDEKYGLLCLILASYEDFLDYKTDIENIYWKKIKAIILSDKENYIDILAYWAVPNENEFKTQFNITPLIREIL